MCLLESLYQLATCRGSHGTFHQQFIETFQKSRKGKPDESHRGQRKTLKTVSTNTSPADMSEAPDSDTPAFACDSRLHYCQLVSFTIPVTIEKDPLNPLLISRYSFLGLPRKKKERKTNVVD